MLTHSALIAETDSLRRFALRLTGNKPDADDLLQSTFLRALEKCDYFEDGTSVRKWASKMMFNIFATEYRRKTKFETQYDAEPYIQAMAVGASQEAYSDVCAVRNAISKLSPDHKKILVMTCIEDKSYQEVSEQMDIPVGTVRSRLSRARAQLQHIMDEPAPKTTMPRHVANAHMASYGLQRAAKSAA